MIIEYIRYTIEESKHQEFIDAYDLASHQLDDSPYCIDYELTHCKENIKNFILRIVWTSIDDHINKFRKSKEFSEFLIHVRPFINNIEEMNHYELTKVTTKK